MLTGGAGRHGGRGGADAQAADAHRHYNEHGGGKERYQTWEAWFSKRLRNRIFYFFHRHAPEGGVRRCLAEWPLAEPQRRADLAVAAE